MSSNKGQKCTQYGIGGARFVLPASFAQSENTGSEPLLREMYCIYYCNEELLEHNIVIVAVNCTAYDVELQKQL